MVKRPDRAGRAAALVLASCLVGAGVLFVPFLTREREVIDSTPNPPPIFEVAEVSFTPGTDLCFREVTLTPSSQVVRLRPTKTFGEMGPKLEVLATGPGYRYAGVLEDYEVAITLDIPIDPPPRPLSASVCVHSSSAPGVGLLATLESRTRSATTTFVDGRAIEPDVMLHLVERRTASIASRLPTVIGHAAAFKPGVVTSGLLWFVALLVVLGVPVATAWAVRAGWRDGDQA